MCDHFLILKDLTSSKSPTPGFDVAGPTPPPEERTDLRRPPPPDASQTFSPDAAQIISAVSSERPAAMAYAMGKPIKYDYLAPRAAAGP